MRLRTKPQEMTTCAECGKVGPVRQIHTYLFCELHKMGWTREQIIANVLFTADALREDADGVS